MGQAIGNKWFTISFGYRHMMHSSFEHIRLGVKMENRWIRRYMGISLVLLFMSTPAMALEPGDMAPDIFGKTLGNKFFKLSATNGAPRLINFFSTTCIPCKKEMPELAKFEKQFTKVKFFSIHVTDQKIETIRKFVKSLPAAPGTTVCASPILKKEYDIPGLPYTVIIDAEGRIRKIVPGYSKKNMKLIKKTLYAF